MGGTATNDRCGVCGGPEADSAGERDVSASYDHVIMDEPSMLTKRDYSDLMAQLEREPEGMRMNELSRRMMVTGGNITGITDQLEAEGLVERAEVEGDRRAYLVRLTPKGRQQFNAMAQAHEAWIVDAFASLGARDIQTLHALLGKVKDHFQETA